MTTPENQPNYNDEALASGFAYGFIGLRNTFLGVGPVAFPQVVGSKDFSYEEVVERLPIHLAEFLHESGEIRLDLIQGNRAVSDMLFNNTGYYDDEIEKEIDAHPTIDGLYAKARQQLESGATSANEETRAEIKARRTVALRVILEDLFDWIEFTQGDDPTGNKEDNVVDIDTQRNAA